MTAPELTKTERVIAWVIERKAEGDATGRYTSYRVEPVVELTPLEETGLWSHLARIFGGWSLTSRF